MSTRSVIARPTEDAELAFAGRYHHSDGYPSGVGRSLFTLIRDHFNGDASRALTVLLDQHPAGWSNIVDADFTLKAGFPKNAFQCPKRYLRDDGRPDYKRWYASPHWRAPRCYCHGVRHERATVVDQDNAYDSGCEYAYVVDPEHRTLTILTVQDGPAYRLVSVVPLAGPEPDWKKLDDVARSA